VADAESMKLNAVRGFFELGFAEGARLLGVGTGSTVSLLIEEAPKSFFERRLFAASSIDTAIRLKKRGATVVDFDLVEEADLYVDSADFFDKDLNLVKGGGAALFKEKLLALRSKRFVVVVDATKLRENLLLEKIPVEVHPLALSYVLRELSKMGLRAEPRTCGRGKWGPVVSESGGILVDVDASSWAGDLASLHSSMKLVTGVVETGIFAGMASAAVVGREAGYEVLAKSR